jgi:hypothetical protein
MSKTEIKPASKSTEKNEIRHMQRFLTRAFSTARITVDEPLTKGGVWSLDLFLPDYHLRLLGRKVKASVLSQATRTATVKGLTKFTRLWKTRFQES